MLPRTNPPSPVSLRAILARAALPVLVLPVLLWAGAGMAWGQTAPAPAKPAATAAKATTKPDAAKSGAARPDAAKAREPFKGNLASQLPTTLQDALAVAYSTNPTLLAERAKLRATDETVPQALAGWRPSVSVNISPGYQSGVTSTVGNNRGQAFGIDVPYGRDTLVDSALITQPIYTGGRTVASTNRAESQVQGERARLIATEQQVFANVITAYVNVIQNQQLVALNNSNVQVLDRQLQATNDRFRVGEITQTDVAQAEAALAGAQAVLQTAMGTLQSARATFRQYVGELPGDLMPPQPVKLPAGSQQALVELAASNNPNVVAAQFDDAAGKDAVDVAFSQLMPQVSVQGGYQKQYNTFESNFSYGGPQVAVVLSMPLYQGGSEYAAVRAAKQSEQQLRKSVDDQRRQAMQLAAQAWETYIAAKATIESTRSQIHANEIALDGVQREALLGTRTTLDVLNAEQLLLNSRSTLIQNLASLITASYSAVAAIGRLTAHDLALPVAAYDETAYYNAVRNKWFGTGDHATDQPGR